MPSSDIISQFFKLSFFKFGQLSANANKPALLTSQLPENGNRFFKSYFLKLHDFQLLPISSALRRGHDLAKIVIESSLIASHPREFRYRNL